MIVSAMVKNEIIPFCSSFVVTLLLVLTDAFVENDIISIFNPVTLFSCGKLFQKFQVIRILETPVYAFCLPIILAVLELILLAISTVLMSRGTLRLHCRLRRCKHEI